MTVGQIRTALSAMEIAAITSTLRRSPLLFSPNRGVVELGSDNGPLLILA